MSSARRLEDRPHCGTPSATTASVSLVLSPSGSNPSSTSATRVRLVVGQRSSFISRPARMVKEEVKQRRPVLGDDDEDGSSTWASLSTRLGGRGADDGRERWKETKFPMGLGCGVIMPRIKEEVVVVCGEDIAY